MTTRVAANIAFSSNQSLLQTSDTYKRDAVQDTWIDVTTTRTDSGNVLAVHEQRDYLRIRKSRIPTAACGIASKCGCDSIGSE